MHGDTLALLVLLPLLLLLLLLLILLLLFVELEDDEDNDDGADSEPVEEDDDALLEALNGDISKYNGNEMNVEIFLWSGRFFECSKRFR